MKTENTKKIENTRKVLSPYLQFALFVATSMVIAIAIFVMPSKVNTLVTSEPAATEAEMITYFNTNKDALEKLKTNVISAYDTQKLTFIGNHTNWRFTPNRKAAIKKYTNSTGLEYALLSGTIDNDEAKKTANEMINQMKAMKILYTDFETVSTTSPEYVFGYENFNEAQRWFFLYKNTAPTNYFSSKCTTQPQAPVSNIEEIVKKENEVKYCLFNNYVVYRSLGNGWYLGYIHAKD